MGCHSVAIARTLDDAALRQRLLDATEQHVLQALCLEKLTQLGEVRNADPGVEVPGKGKAP